MKWVELFPMDSFKDEEVEITTAVLNPVAWFGMVLKREASQLHLYCGMDPDEIHHITSLEKVEAREVPVDEVMSGRMKTLRMRKKTMYPLCVEPVPALLYQQARSLGDFTFGILGRRVKSDVIRRPAMSFIDKSTSKEKGRKSEILEPLKWKYAQESFFCCTILFDCKKETVKPLLSSINFVSSMMEPNSLVPGPARDAGRAAKLPPGIPGFGGSRVPVLSVTEIVSILPLPPQMWGVELEAGSQRTFSNMAPSGPDPAEFLRDGTASSDNRELPEGWDEGAEDPADYFK